MAVDVMEVVEEEVEDLNAYEREGGEEEGNRFRGFLENDRREHGLAGFRNWFGGFAEYVGWVEGFGGEGDGGASDNEEQGELNVGAVGGEAGGRIFIGRRSRCRICEEEVSYANRARHEETHRAWDPGGGPHPA